jgi:hypothetical protein
LQGTLAKQTSDVKERLELKIDVPQQDEAAPPSYNPDGK